MKQHTQGFKDAQASLGKEQDIIISYGNTTLTSEDINSFTYSFEGNILKSIMTCIEVETNVDIPLNTKFNLQYGLKVNGSYEYLSFNNYIVYSSEKQEDKACYRIIAYDEMLDTMKDYEQVNIAYPCTVANYVEALAEELGYTYTSGSFPNDTRILNGDYFVNAGYTYRDVLDDIAEVTASNIIVKNGELIISNSVQTNETFDDKFIKTTNADFKVYGPINSIVLSRSISDNIYAKDQESIEENGLFEIKISDNQIMNNINRNEYISAIYNKLHGTYFTLYDFDSIGIGYLEPLDKFSITIGETSYSDLILFNDNYVSKDGISENLHMEEPVQSQTDYKKADTTDQRINQTNLIVDKQAQTITGLITTVEDNVEQVSTLTQTVDGFSADISRANTNANQARQQTAQLSLDVAELRSEIGDVIDITVTEEGYGTLSFEDINQSEPITIAIHSMGADIKYLYPSETLYPGATLYPLSRTIVFENLDTNEKTIYTLPDDLLWYSSSVYDEFYMDYDTKTCQITKRVGIDQYGDKYPLIPEEVVTYSYPTLELANGDYSVYTPSYPSAHLKVRLMHQNPYVKQFATRAEMNSAIRQSATEIENYVGLTYYLKEEGHTLESRVTQTESDITSEVADRTQADTQLNSLITQNSTAINLEVNARTNLQSDYNSTKNKVASLELGVGELGDDVDDLGRTKINKVTGKTDADSIVSYINASANVIDLRANRFSLQSDHLDITTDGILKSKYNYSSNDQRQVELGTRGLIFKRNNGELGSVEYISYGGSSLMSPYFCGETYNSGGLGLGLVHNGSVIPLVRYYHNIDGVRNNMYIKLGDYSYYERNTLVLDPYFSTFAIEFSDYDWLHFFTNGNFAVSGDILGVNSSCDARLKHDINDTETSGLDKINQIIHRKFKWNKDNKEIDIGYIAQELEEIDPNFVIIEKESGQYYIDERNILATATKAIQELSNKVNELEETCQKQQEMINQLLELNNIEIPKAKKKGKEKSRTKHAVKEYKEPIKQIKRQELEIKDTILKPEELKK